MHASPSDDLARANFANVVHNLRDEIVHYNKSRCAGCYVICKIITSNGSIDASSTFNQILYVGKGNLDRAMAHFPKKNNNFISFTKQQKALISLLSKKFKIGVIALHCCHSAVAFACEKVLIQHFKSSIFNSYSGHKLSLSPEALDLLETAALELLFSKISSQSFDLEY